MTVFTVGFSIQELALQLRSRAYSDMGNIFYGNMLIVNISYFVLWKWPNNGGIYTPLSIDNVQGFTVAYKSNSDDYTKLEQSSFSKSHHANIFCFFICESWFSGVFALLIFELCAGNLMYLTTSIDFACHKQNKTMLVCHIPESSLVYMSESFKYRPTSWCKLYLSPSMILGL